MKYSEGIAHLCLKLQDIMSVDGLEQELCILSKMFIPAKIGMPELANWHEKNISLS